tara:strand:+ start:1599 stop:1781 length:183 start_codon:yes stop_codon:yes gene_type:complete
MTHTVDRMVSIYELRQAVEKLMDQYDQSDYADCTYKDNNIIEAEVGTKNWRIVIQRREND